MRVPRDDEAGHNGRFYDRLWAGVRLRAPQDFNTWPLLSRLCRPTSWCLEVGPGMRPRLPIAGSHFVEMSRPAVRALRARGGLAARAEIGALPYPDDAFDLVCAFDIVEHVADDGRAFAEIARVVRPGGTIVLSVPLYMAAWTAFDGLVGHYRRYEPAELEAALAAHGVVVGESAAYGMQPRSQLLIRLGMWWLEHHRAHAMAFYDRFFMPLALRLQRRLEFVPGIVRDRRVDEVVLVCRRARPRRAGADRQCSLSLSP